MAFEPRQPLTATEIVIADLAGRGKPNEEIASELGLDRATVARQLAEAFRKLGVRSGAELAARAAHEERT